jgi:hypothetical protein
LVYFITFTLNSGRETQQALLKEIDSIGPYINPLHSVFILHSQLTSELIKQRLQKHINKIDELFVSKMPLDDYAQTSWPPYNPNTLKAFIEHSL